MNCICIRCGSPKEIVNQGCRGCGFHPQTERDIAHSVYFSRLYFDAGKLDEISSLIRDGYPVEMPVGAEMAVMERIRRETASSKGGSLWGKIKLGLVAAVVLYLFFSFNSWPQFQWASFKDTEEGYGHFLARFPFSEQADEAEKCFNILKEKRHWNNVGESGDINLLRKFAEEFPAGRFLADAKRQITAAADRKWSEIDGTESLPVIEGFLAQYPETSMKDVASARMKEIVAARWAAMAETRSSKDLNGFIQVYGRYPEAVEAVTRLNELMDDAEWVKEQDTLDYYRRFVKTKPTHPFVPDFEKRIITLEVQEIAAGEHGKMPKAEAVSQGGTTTNVDVENKTGYVLTIRYSGPDVKKLVVSVNETKTITLSPGSYAVAASVDAANVTNYYGTDSMTGGRYSSSFYIQTSSGGTLPSFPRFRK